MIGDVKTALDRYLTHSLTRTLDRQSSDFFLAGVGCVRGGVLVRWAGGGVPGPCLSVDMGKP